MSSGAGRTAPRSDSDSGPRMLLADQVVVLEDDDADQRFLRRAVEQAGFDVELTMCDDIATARSAIEEGDPVLIIVDLSIPGGKGVNLIAELRRSRPTTPAVVLTSSTAPWDHQGAIAAGARAVHTKPFEWEDYRNLVERMLRYWLG